MRKLLLATLATAMLGTAATVHAQDSTSFPRRTVTLVVPFTPGSGSDTIARIIGPRLAARWGQAVVVDNRPGASGNLGTQFAARAAPDGHTLLMALNTLTMAPAIYKAVPYDPLRDFAPVTQLASAHYVLAVHPGVPAQDMASLLAHMKRNPGKLSYASPGNGTPHHFAMELLKGDQGLFAVHVPYKGIAGALTDLMGGHVQLMFATIPSIKPHADAGKVRLLAVTGAAGNPLLPGVRTFREQGHGGMDSIDAWYAVLAPAQTPPDLVARLNKDFAEVINAEDVKAELARQGLVVRTGSSAQLRSLIAADLQRWQKVVRTAGIQMD